MYTLLYTPSQDAVVASQLINKGGLELTPLPELVNLAQFVPFGIINGDGYLHGQTLEFVSHLPSDRPVTYVHIDNHSDREFDSRWELGEVSYANFTIPLGRLRNVSRVIYLEINPRFILDRANTAEYCIELLSRCEVYSGQHTTFRGLDFFNRNPEKGDWMAIPKEILEVAETNGSVKSIANYKFDHTCSIAWKSITDFDPERIETSDAYVSIDLDVLKSDVPIPTNPRFKRGILSLETLMELVRNIKQRKNIIGFDITGFYQNEHTTQTDSLVDIVRSFI